MIQSGILKAEAEGNVSQTISTLDGKIVTNYSGGEEIILQH
jgi:hypothetical protein